MRSSRCCRRSVLAVCGFPRPTAWNSLRNAESLRGYKGRLLAVARPGLRRRGVGGGAVACERGHFAGRCRGKLALLQASVIYLDLEGAEHRLPEAWLTLPLIPAEKFLAISEDQDVIRRVKEAEAAKLQEAASRAAKRGDWKEVEKLLAEAKEMASHSRGWARSWRTLKSWRHSGMMFFSARRLGTPRAT